MTGRQYHISLHAEMNALFHALKSNKKFDFKQKSNMCFSTIYVTRLLNNDRSKYRLGNAKPCENCQKYLSMYGVKRVKYTDIIDGENVLCELRLC